MRVLPILIINEPVNQRTNERKKSLRPLCLCGKIDSCLLCLRKKCPEIIPGIKTKRTTTKILLTQTYSRPKLNLEY